MKFIKRKLETWRNEGTSRARVEQLDCGQSWWMVFWELMEATFLKHPLYWKPSSPAMIVPSKDHVAQLLIQVFHQKLAHDGQDRTLAQLREQFWTPKGRSAVHKVVRSCLTCKKQRVVGMELMMAKFPAFRTHSLWAMLHIYNGIPISRTLGFPNLPIFRTKL